MRGHYTTGFLKKYITANSSSLSVALFVKVGFLFQSVGVVDPKNIIFF